MHGVDMAAHLLCGLRVERGARGRQSDEDALREPGGDLGERAGVGGPDVAVAEGADESRERLGQVADVGVPAS